MPILKKDQDCNAIVTALDGSQVEISASQLWDQGLARWQGWRCSAGHDMVYIDHDFTVYSGHCHNDCLGNLFDPAFRLLSDYTVCRREVCTPCTGDLYAAKYNPTVDQ